MSQTVHISNHRAWYRWILLLSVLVAVDAVAQPALKHYTVRKGRMVIDLGKTISTPSLDSFILQFDLGELDLKTFLRTGNADSLIKLGWKVETNTGEWLTLSKPIEGLPGIGKPEQKILYTEKRDRGEAVFPKVSSKILFGINRFRNKRPFAVRDSAVTFFLKGNEWASKVILSGSFSDWSTSAIPMTRTDSGWIIEVKLAPGKYWYKFIVDGNWQEDPDNYTKENDGRGNINSVYFKTNYSLRLDSFTNARNVILSGSFNDWKHRDIQMTRTATGWALDLYLANGTHTYRFVVDGRWMADPFNPEKLPNEFNEYNSVIRIGKSYLFRIDGYQDASQVILAGSFNKWRKDELFMRKINGGWELLYTLGPGNYEYTFMIDGKKSAAPSENANGNLVFIIEPNFTFRLRGYPNARQVFLAGDFNGWSPGSFSMKREGEEWVLKVHLYPGKHEYKFIVDGKWIIDPENKSWEQNEHRSGNSVIWVEPSE